MKLALICLLAAPFAWSQAAPPEFEVASVRVIEPGKGVREASKIDNSYFTMSGMPLRMLVSTAYNVWPNQVSGPDWLDSLFVEVRAKLPPGATEEQVPVMLRALLRNRFNAAIREEQKEQPVYLLTAGKSNKLTPAAATETDAGDTPPETQSLPTPLGTVHVSQGQGGEVISGKGLGTMRLGMGKDGAMHLEATRITMKVLAAFLSTAGGQRGGRVVVDKTGLEGAYRFSVDLSMAEMMGGGGRGEGGPPSASDPGVNPLMRIVEAVGMKIDSGKAVVPTITVDKMDKAPTDN